jgi:phosphopentomutase
MKRAVILVLDSFGIGAAGDAERFGDAGADTLGHIAAHCARAAAAGTRARPLTLPNLTRMGLMHAARESTGRYPEGCDADVELTGAYGYAREISSGKDTPSGHWEIAGVPVLFEWGYFRDRTNTFPAALLDRLVELARLPGVLGNCHASGTEIIARLGEEHVRTGRPIVYTSADSVFQIACHEGSFGLQRLYEVCEIARGLVDDYRIGRVIARPFIGRSSRDFQRTGNRRDYTTPPPSATLLDELVARGGRVVSIGKIGDIFAHQGITEHIKATGNAALFDATLTAVGSAPDRTIVFTNFVDFDMLYGHRRDVDGYATALEYFDGRLPELLARLGPDDLLVLCADHGCDPTCPGSDHTREHIPVLVRGGGVPAGSLGRRETFADIGQTLAAYFGLPPMQYGTSFIR